MPVNPTSNATCRRGLPANEKPIFVNGPPFISELATGGFAECQVKPSLSPATQTGFTSPHIINGRDYGLPLFLSVFTSQEVVFTLPADSNSLQSFLLIQAIIRPMFLQLTAPKLLQLMPQIFWQSSRIPFNITQTTAST
jgi:hypothetical protein